VEGETSARRIEEKKEGGGGLGSNELLMKRMGIFQNVTFATWMGAGGELVSSAQGSSLKRDGGRRSALKRKGAVCTDGAIL